MEEERMEICKACPLYKEDIFGAICDSKKYMNKDGDVSYLPKDNFKAGCGCILKNKVNNPKSRCPHNKW